MKILVANLGSTSFKYRLYEIAEGVETPLAKGGYERVSDFGATIDDCLRKLTAEGHLASPEALDAVGFKCVMGGETTGCLRADETVLRALEDFRYVAPAHNPVYAEAIRQFARVAPTVERVALFETAFYQWTPEAAKHYAVPRSWWDAGVRRYGYHGASHKFIAERSAAFLGRDDVARRVRDLYRAGPGPEPSSPFRVISCHLGGSSSICGIRNGLAIGASMGFSPQSGLPQNNRVGDLDSMAIPFMVEEKGLSVREAKEQLSKEGGLLGLSGVSNDMRDILAAASEGNARAQLALDFLTHRIRHWIGAFLVQMGGCEALVFTAGIGENHPWLRESVCDGLAELGIAIDPERNARPAGEADVSTPSSKPRVLVLPTNEELVLARETYRFLS